ncbi:HAD-IC family P-type ATPase [Streptomyces albireticuli]|nr:HAD-IC family P-type ATPase [Streptomyces albireticuli]MCD9142443.1 HAD-IC family P-type ATPase [Streptomyces albireticuli]MCD9163843.1 HAD-IC family P-type ATPase [Streptomyces albireticuli]MCD9192571.1 HAD-IC family P-type ATPase [Streptomyces albireticuli]
MGWAPDGAGAAGTTLEALRALGSGPRGLVEQQAEERLAAHGENVFPGRRPASWPRRLARSLRDPFTAVLLGLGLVSAAVASWGTACVIAVLVAVSCVLRATGEHRADHAAATLRDLIAATATVRRRATAASPPRARELPVDQLVPGDVVLLAPGDVVPADLRLLRATGLTLHEAALTGESAPVEKRVPAAGGAVAHAPGRPAVVAAPPRLPADQERSPGAAHHPGPRPAATPDRPGAPAARTPLTRPDLCLQGSSVVSGSGVGVVIATGADTVLSGALPRGPERRPRPIRPFDRSVNGIAWTLVRFMLLTAPVVLIAGALLRGRGMETLPFAVAVAVGLTPEMLPVVVTTALARGAALLARGGEVVVRRLPALHDLGAVDVLCVDKTGTLTQDRPVVARSVDTDGRDDPAVLRWAAVNALWTLHLAELPAPDALDEAILDADEAAAASGAYGTELDEETGPDGGTEPGSGTMPDGGTEAYERNGARPAGLPGLTASPTSGTTDGTADGTAPAGGATAWNRARAADAPGHATSPTAGTTDGTADETTYESTRAGGATAPPDPSDTPARHLRAVPSSPASPASPFDELEGVAALPYGPGRRVATAVVAGGRVHTLVVKGAPEDVLERCALDDEDRARLARRADGLAADGLRVLAVAVAERPARARPYTPADERGLTLLGFVGLRDALAPTAADALTALSRRGVTVKVLTGDHPGTAARACRELGLKPGEVVTGDRIDALTGPELAGLASRSTVFARCAPEHKARIVEALRAAGHTTGFLGDGVNDLAALRSADVGICPRDGVDVAREAADVVLASKDLTALDRAIVTGRRSTGNIAAYLRITLSSNLGNVIAMLAAGLMLPFLPMLPAQVLVQNLCFDAAQLALAFDRPGPDAHRRPAVLRPRALLRFMTGFGLLNAVADLATFGVLALALRSMGEEEGQAAFHAGWFTENLLTQALVMLLLRSGRRAAEGRVPGPIRIATSALAVVGLLLPLSPLGPVLGMSALPPLYYGLMAVVLALYGVGLAAARKRFAAPPAEL